MPTKLNLVVINPNYSSWSLRAYLALSWSKLDFSITKFDLDDDFKANIKPYSSIGTVPVLMVDDAAVCDSLAIAAVVGELSGQSLWPQSQRHRWQAYSAVAHMHSGFSTVRRLFPMNMRKQFGGNSWQRLVRTSSDSNKLEQELQLLRQLLSQLLQHGGPWLNGAQPGMVDAFYAPIASRALSYDLSLSPELSQWQQLILSEASVQRWQRMGLSDPIIAVDEVDLK